MRSTTSTTTKKMVTTSAQTILPAYGPTGPLPLTTAPADCGQSGSSLPLETETPSWLPDMSTPRLFRTHLAHINTDNKTERIAWTESHCLGQLRQVLSFAGRCLGTVVMAQGFPPTWKDAAQMITAFLEQAAVSSKQGVSCSRTTSRAPFMPRWTLY